MDPALQNNFRVFRGLETYTLSDGCFEFADGHADLFQGVAVADGDGVVLQCVEVDGDAKAFGVYPSISLFPEYEADLIGKAA